MRNIRERQNDRMIEGETETETETEGKRCITNLNHEFVFWHFSSTIDLVKIEKFITDFT